MDEDFKKSAIVGCMRGKAVEMIQGNGIDQGIYRESILSRAYIDKLGEIFVPPEESDLATVQFEGLKQGKMQDIQTYIKLKIQLYNVRESVTGHQCNLIGVGHGSISDQRKTRACYRYSTGFIS